MDKVNKLTAAVVATAATTVICWALRQFANIDLPADVQGAVTTLIAGAAVYFGPANSPAATQESN